MDAVNACIRYRLVSSWVVATIFCSIAGCGFINPQVDVEVDFAMKMARWMKLYDVTNTDVPITNMTQVFLSHYPYKEHQRLSRFGKDSGFKVSIEEKYMFFWPRLSHSDLHGEVVCMGVRPFSWGDEGLHRIYISKMGGDYRYWRITEERVQAILQEAKPSIVPLPPIKPPSPPPPELQPYLERTLNRRYEEFVWDLSGALGQDSSTPVRIILKVGAFIVISTLTFFCVFFIRRSRRKSSAYNGHANHHTS